MGLINKALTPVSSHAAKQTTLWDELMGDLAACMTEDDICHFEAKLARLELSIPASWRGSLVDQVTLRHEEIGTENIGAIMRAKYDF